MKIRMHIPLALGAILLTGCGKGIAPAPSSPPNNETTPVPAATAAPSTPTDIPLPPGTLANVSGQDREGTAVWDTGESNIGLYDFFTSELPANGWVLDSVSRAETVQKLDFRQGARFLQIQLGAGPGPGMSHVQLAWDTMDEANESSDAFEPELDEGSADVDGDIPQW
jgi:hypothetical protein